MIDIWEIIYVHGEIFTTVSIHGKAGQIPFQLEFVNSNDCNPEEKSSVEHFTKKEFFRLSMPVSAFIGINKSVEVDFQQMVNSREYPYILVEVPEDLLLSHDSLKNNCHAEISILIAGNSKVVPVSYGWCDDEQGRRVFCGTTQLLLSYFYLAPEKRILGLLKIRDLIFINFELLKEDLFFIEPN